MSSAEMFGKEELSLLIVVSVAAGCCCFTVYDGTQTVLYDIRNVKPVVRVMYMQSKIRFQ
jgi:hypothetical protein